MQVERYEFDKMVNEWKSGKYVGQRLGQAFYNHFNCHRMRPTPFLDRIYEMDKERALSFIFKNVTFSQFWSEAQR